MRNGKQFSFWHVLPKSKTELQTLIPRKSLQDKIFNTDYSVKIELPLLLFVIHKLINTTKSQTTSPIIEIKRSTLRNFIGKKIHSKRADALDLSVDSFLESLKCAKYKTLFFEKKLNKIVFSFESSFFNLLKSGNTVSFNLFDLTSIRGEKAKTLFLSVLCFDLRKSERYSKYSNLVNFLSLSFNKRKESIRKIKRAFLSLERKGFVLFKGYTGLSGNQSYLFEYNLKSLLQRA